MRKILRYTLFAIAGLLAIVAIFFPTDAVIVGRTDNANDKVSPEEEQPTVDVQHEEVK